MSQGRRTAIMGAALSALLLAGGTAARAQVSATPLAAPDLFAAGAHDTGLSPTLWVGSSAQIARRAIPKLTPGRLSPAFATLARRVLATAGRAPDGAGEDASLAGARAAALLQLGDTAIVADLIEHTPGVERSLDLSRAAAAANLILGRIDKACGVLDVLAVGRDDPYWPKLRAWCLLRQGKTSEAEIVYNLAINQPVQDEPYARLMGVKLAGVGDPGAASVLNSLDFALSRDMNLDLAPVAKSAPPAVLSVLANDAGVAPAARELARHEGVMRGLLPPATEPELSDPVALAQALKAAKSGPTFQGVALLSRATLARLDPAALAEGDRVVLAMAAAAAGEVERARLIRRAIADGTAPFGELMLLDAVLEVAGGGPGEGALDRLAEVSTNADPRLRALASAALAIAAPLQPRGLALSGEGRAILSSRTEMDSRLGAARGLALDEAAQGGRVGETALLALEVAAEPPSGGFLLPADRGRIEAALARTGELAGAARAIALEGLLELAVRPAPAPAALPTPSRTAARPPARPPGRTARPDDERRAQGRGLPGDDGGGARRLRPHAQGLSRRPRRCGGAPRGPGARPDRRRRDRHRGLFRDAGRARP